MSCPNSHTPIPAGAAASIGGGASAVVHAGGLQQLDAEITCCDRGGRRCGLAAAALRAVGRRDHEHGPMRRHRERAQHHDREAGAAEEGGPHGRR